jgi:hypothetical protein
MKRSAAEQRCIDLTILGILPRSFPQWAKPHCTMETALRLTASEVLPWEIRDEDLFWTTEGDTNEQPTYCV